jgi:tetratricopeptide (TPR) repeat protein
VSRRGVLGAALVLGAIVAIVPLSLALESRAPRIQDGAGAPPVLPRARVLRPLLLGFHPLAADLYWVRTIQYFGAHIQTDREFPHLYALVDLVTSLDPHFVEAYQLGGLFLIIGKRLPEAIAIYEKGIAANPERWELPYDLGRLYFLDLKDEVQALRWWEVTDRLPGRPDYIPRFLARLSAKTGSLETAFELWKAMYEGSDNEWVRKTAKQEMQKILAQMRAHTPSKTDQ